MKEPSGSGLTKYTDYIVPNVFQKSVKKALKREYFSTKLLQQLDTEVVNETCQNAIKSLTLWPEIELCMSAAQALVIWESLDHKILQQCHFMPYPTNGQVS